MEILQTIWTGLTTENPGIINNYFSIPMMLIESFISMLLFTQILNITYTKRQVFIYVILFSIIGIFSQFIISTPYNTFINMIGSLILIFFIFKIDVFKSLVANILPSVIFVIIGSIIQILFSLIFDISINTIEIIPIYRVTFSIITYIIIYIIYILLKHFNIRITLLDSMKRNNFYILITNFIVGAFTIALQSYLAALYFPTLILSVNIIALFTYFMVSMVSLYRTNKLEITTKNLEEEKLYNQTLTILYDNIRGFKHDFNNIVQTIGGYMTTENMEGLKKYYSELLEDCQLVNNLTVLSPEVINNPAIYSLLTSKYHKADELGIKMNLEVFMDLTTINMKIYQLTRILGILLDNAIEAAKDCEEKIINVFVRKDSKANRQLFIIENTYFNKDIDTDKIFEKGYTTKKNIDPKGHGLGLWEVRQILRRNNNLNLYPTKDDDLFKQQLEIYY